MTQQGAGISAAGPMWHEFMAKALDSYLNERFVSPAPLSGNKIMLDGNYIYTKDVMFPTEFLDPLKQGQETTPRSEYHSILYFVNRSDPKGPFPEDPSKDLQFNNWEWSVQNIFAPKQPVP